MKRLINKIIQFFLSKNKSNDDNLKRIKELETELFGLKQNSFNDLNINVLASKEDKYNNIMKNIVDSCLRLNNYYKKQKDYSSNVIPEKNIYNDIKNLIHKISNSNDGYSLFLIFKDIDNIISNYKKEYKEICDEAKSVNKEIKNFNNISNKNFKSFKRFFKLNKKYDINKHHETITSIIKRNELGDKKRIINARKNNYQYIFENLDDIINNKNSNKYDVAIELKKIFNKVMRRYTSPVVNDIKLDSVNENDINLFVKEKINNEETCIKGLSIIESIKQEIEKRKNG